MSSVDALLRQAITLLGANDLSAASDALESVLIKEPGNVQANTQLAIVRLQQGRPEDAMAHAQRAIATDPESAPAHTWYAEALRRRGENAKAALSFESALRLKPDLPPALFNLALAYVDLGRHGDARAAWIKFLSLRPKDGRVRTELGKLALASGNADEAEAWFKEQLQVRPQDLHAICDLAAAIQAKGDGGRVRKLVEPVLPHARSFPRLWLALAYSYLNEGRLQEAAGVLRQAAAEVPESGAVAALLGTTEDRLANLPSAIAAFERAVALQPERADLRNGLGVAHLNLANHEAALAQFRQAVALDEAFAASHSNLLMALHYVQGMTPEAMFEEHLEYGRRHARPQAHHGRPRPDRRRRIRVGYLSPRFGGGPLAHFVLPLLRHHDRSRFEIFCYATSSESDVATVEMQRHVDHWRQGAELDDDALARVVRSDELDILVDLVGHCPGGRLPMLSTRLAPIQVTWMDYVNTTGIEAMDYVLTDEGHTPTITRQRFSERVVRLAGVRLCYEPVADLPPLSPPPSLERGFVTFGCFNRLSKIGLPVIEAWSRILAELPTARLILKAGAFASDETQRVVRERFARFGVEPHRLSLQPFAVEREMLAEYRNVDIALDPFPYCGCTTTCDALVMGVPVISLAGETLAGRHGVSILGATGLHEFIAHSLEAYHAKVVALATNADKLTSLRAELRGRFIGSPMCDAPSFARTVEDAYTNMIADANSR